MSNSYLSFIKARYPSYVQREYPRFANLLTDYFAYLYKEGNPLQYVSDYLDNHDTSNEQSQYWDKILADLGYLLDSPIKIERRQLVTFLRDYYSARGSKNGLHFLFKLLYNDEPTVSYPRDDMLVPSFALNERNQILYCDLTNVPDTALRLLYEQLAVYQLHGQGLTSNARFYVDRFTVIDNTGRLVISISDSLLPFETLRFSTGLEVPSHCILQLSNLTANRPYTTDTVLPVEGDVLNGSYRIAKISHGVIQSITITNGGKKYKVGDGIIAVSGSRNGFYGRVTKVTAQGKIQQVAIDNHGYYLYSLPSLAVLSEQGEGAVLTPVSDNIGRPVEIEVVEPTVVSSRYMTRRYDDGNLQADISPIAVYTTGLLRKSHTGVLEQQCVITDSYYYQESSYRIHSKIPRAEYIAAVKRDNHPAGNVLLSRLLVAHKVRYNPTVSSSIKITP